MPTLPRRRAGTLIWGDSGKDARTLMKLRQLLGRADEDDRRLLLFMAKKMVKTKPS
jgi:hypothetical protein